MRGNDNEARMRVAQEAARVMVNEGVRDFALAKRKAAERLGINSTKHLPANQEIERCVSEYQRLFQSDTQPEQLQSLRQASVWVMKMLQQFDPRLVGSVLAGTASAHSVINLHVFSEPPEAIVIHLSGRGFQCMENQQRLRMEDNSSSEYPVFVFDLDAVPVEVTVFPLAERQHAPRSPVDGRPMHRAGIKEVIALLGDDTDTGLPK